MTTAQVGDFGPTPITPGQRVRLPGESRIVVVELAVPGHGDVHLYVQDDESVDTFRRVSLTVEQASRVEVISEDGAAAPEVVIAGLWTEWMLGAVRSARSTVLASTPLRPFPHQMAAVYGQMITQPLLRFLLADEPGTGKTIMSGLWLREAQRKGLVKRALVVCPAHLVIKWRADFERFFGGGLREVTAETIRQRALSVPGEDLWVVSLNLASVNPSVREALHPDKAGWDAIIFDEAHRMTPTAQTFHRVGRELSATVPHAVFLTATPHRGDEWLFRELLHLVDPDVFPTSREPESGLPRQTRSGSDRAGIGAPLKPGPLHFLRRMKEELVDYDSRSLLFKEREAVNVKVPMTSEEQRFYDRAQDLVNEYFHVRGRALAAMVYGKRAASSLYALARTLRRRLVKMGTADALSGEDHPEEDDDEREERVVTARSLNARAERKAINAMLAELEPIVGLGSDQLVLGDLDVSKWKPMLGCLRDNGLSPGSGQQLVVFTEYADTAAWLVGMFANEGFKAEQYSGSQNHTERAAIQARFMDGRFEVIVSTDAGNEGIDLQAAHVLVNWDIPWSLVRLEQRMGRIHRIGQQHKVYLYNLVALGTREGQAHERLLDRLIEAANELDGKMFDSLQAIMERVRGCTGTSGEHEKLLRLFYDTDSGASSISDWPTLDEIRKARDDYYSEIRALSSEVDVPTANAALHDDHIARVNPIIVERFLDRIESGGLLECHLAPIGDEGFYYLSASTAEHGWELPEALRPSNGSALVATRADTRQKAIADGHERAAEALMLGPSDPALTALVSSLRERVTTEMWRGATLGDESARTDYSLFVYECDIVEGSDGPSPRHRQRSSTISWLVRVDSTGLAQPISWDSLPNLTSVPDLTPISLAPTVAEAAERRVARAADAERDRRADVLAGWVKQLSTQLRRLPNALTDPITDRDVRLAQRTRIEATIRERISEAKMAARVTRGEPRRVGWAHIVAVSQDDPDANADEQADSEAVSMRLVTALLKNDDWHVDDVHTEGRGYDLHARRGAQQRCVEVKGRAGKASSTGITLTGGELAQASQLGDDYWLYVVEHCSDGEGQLYGAWQNPAETFRDSFADVHIVRLPGSELRAALNKQGEAS
ncbi:MAG: helicase-related protein [bacterium]|nr:helicase-related protein [bacterium]